MVCRVVLTPAMGTRATGMPKHGRGPLRGDGHPPADPDQADRRADVVHRGGQFRLETRRDTQGHDQAPEGAARADDPGFPAQFGHGGLVGPGQPVPGRHAQPERVVAEVPLAQPGPGPGRRRAEAGHDRHVEPVAQDRVGAGLVGAGDELDLDLRELPAHLHQRVAHDLRALAERHADPQPSADGLVVPAQRRFRGPQLDQDPFGVLEQHPAGRGKGDPVAVPVNERGARLGLQGRQLLGDGRPGVAQRPGGRRDRALGGHSPQHDEFADIEHASHPLTPSVADSNSRLLVVGSQRLL